MVTLTKTEADTLAAFLDRVQVKGTREARVIVYLADKLMAKEETEDATQQSGPEPKEAGTDNSAAAGDADVQSK